MHALGPENGELRAGSVTERSRSLRGVQNVPIYYVAVARTEGTVYYVSSIEGAAGLLPYPWLRPVAVDHEKLPNELYVGVQQSVLGQIGFRLDSRIYGVRVARLPGFDSWWGGAHAADGLITKEIQEGVFAEKGGQWQICLEQSGNDNSDNSYLEPEMLAVLDPGAPSGLIYAVVAVANLSKAGLLWRFLDANNHWRLELSAGVCEIVLVSGGSRQTLAFHEYQSDDVSLKRLQILDDGMHWMAYIDGNPLLDTWITDTRLHEATKVGIWRLNDPKQDHATIHTFEAHPRQLRLPNALDMGAPWLREGTQIVVEDNFAGEAGDLEGRTTLIGEKCWRRIIGKGIINVTGINTARIQSSIQEPCPGRTAYCVDWPYPDFVDIEAVITPPGNQRGQNQRTTAGFIIYQDSKNYVVLNLWRSDFYAGGSVSTFFRFGGFEDIYDAIWTNVADRVYYGKPLKLRLCCDGEHYLAFINDEAVLYRAFRDVYADVERLRIREIGLIANWEFGMDTGSEFKNFKARTYAHVASASTTHSMYTEK
ncbi:MAG: nucleotide-binding protein [Candidatus Competibacter sp.]|nr:nucleotide-binding protein [Candidatus Competibacter sp.]